MPVDLTTSYMGIPLKHPVVASASPLSHTLDGIRRLEDGGASAIVLFSLFEEQIRFEQDSWDHLSAVGSEAFAESLSYFPPVVQHEVGPFGYVELIRQAKAAVRIPVIASLNGVTPEGWCDFAREIADAGADAIELNLFCVPTDVACTGREVEDLYESVVRHVARAAGVPIAVKLSPFFSATGEMARRLVDAGAAALVLFDRFYQPDFDLDRMEVLPDLQLSSPAEIRLPLLWIAVLHGRCNASLAATTGVESGTEVVKFLLAGADVVMTASSLLRYGPAHAEALVTQLSTWMESRGYTSVQQMKGSMSQQKVRDPSVFARANYMRVLNSYQNPFVP